jgi:selenocysteine-specific elongation factor
VAVSAYTGSGIPGLRNSLAQLAHGVPERSRDSVVRLPVDRSFVIKGFGTVATGTLMGGSVAQGDRLAIEPGGRSVKVRRVQTHGRTEERVAAGCRAALNLSGVETSEVGRGHTLVDPDLLKAVNTVDVEVTVLDGMPELKHRARMHFHAFASECMAAVTLYNAAAIAPGNTGLARLRLSQAVVLLPGDRFVLRRGSPAMTMGGGRVLDAHPLLDMRKAKTADWLMSLRASSREEAIWLRIARRGTAAIDLRQLSAETGLLATALADVVGRWISDGRVSQLGDGWLLTRESLNETERLIQKAFVPAGMRRAQLRERAGLKQNVFDFALQRLEAEKQLRSAGEMVLPFVASAKPAPEKSRLDAVRQAFEKAGITPPSPGELSAQLGITAEEMRKLITELLREKVLVRLGSDSLCADRKALEALVERVRGLRGTRMDVGTFKQLAGVSRKYAIPLLEYLDREHVTRQEGDRRLVL